MKNMAWQAWLPKTKQHHIGRDYCQRVGDGEGGREREKERGRKRERGGGVGDVKTPYLSLSSNQAKDPKATNSAPVCSAC